MTKSFQYLLKYVFQYNEKGKEEPDIPRLSTSEFHNISNVLESTTETVHFCFHASIH